jgi:hypothetical protein
LAARVKADRVRIGLQDAEERGHEAVGGQVSDELIVDVLIDLIEARAEPQAPTSWPTLLAAPAAAALFAAMMLTLTSLPG